MLKGINRRIIEINRTNNDYFEKAILFVKSDKSNCNKQTLSDQASQFLNNLPSNNKNKKIKSKIIIYSIFSLIVLLITFSIVYSIFYL